MFSSDGTAPGVILLMGGFHYTAPWGFTPWASTPHEWVTTPWRYLLWLREHHICKGSPGPL